MSEDVWSRIARLRISDESLLAPSLKNGLAIARQRISELQTAGTDHAKGLEKDDIGLSFTVVETLRVQALQDIYFQRQATKARSVLKSWHGYACAFDFVHPVYMWFTNKKSIEKWPSKSDRNRASVLWYAAMGRIFIDTGLLAWGGLWKNFPDSPHVQSSLTPVTPPQSAIDAYNRGKTRKTPEDGRRLVWQMFNLL